MERGTINNTIYNVINIYKKNLNFSNAYIKANLNILKLLLYV